MSTLLARAIGSISSLLALIPQPLLPRGEGEQDFKVPLPVGEGFRVRAVRSLAKVIILPRDRSYSFWVRRLSFLFSPLPPHSSKSFIHPVVPRFLRLGNREYRDSSRYLPSIHPTDSRLLCCTSKVFHQNG